MAKKKPKNKTKHKKKRGKINEKKIRVSKNFAPARRLNVGHRGGNKKKAKRESIANGVHKTKIRVIGIGGGGGSIVSEIISRIKKADFVAANTDARALRAIRGAKQFQFGRDLTQGLGTGMNAEIGEAAAQNEKEKIKKLFEGQDVCIIISCLGGGTGCGATPIFAKISKNLNCLTYGIFTLPFEFEGEKKIEIAKEALLKIKPYLNIYSVIPNERIFQIIDKNTPLRDALSAINKQLAENLEGLIEMIYLPGLINIDFADLKTILSGRGRLAYLKTVGIKEPEKEEAAKKLISSRFYPYTLQGARGILYNIVGGRNLQLSDVSRISKIISNSLNKNAKIIFGISQRPEKRDKINLTILATGCNIKGEFLKPVHPAKSGAGSAGSSAKSGAKNGSSAVRQSGSQSGGQSSGLSAIKKTKRKIKRNKKDSVSSDKTASENKKRVRPDSAEQARPAGQVKIYRKKKKSGGDSLKDSVKKQAAKSLKPRPEMNKKEKIIPLKAEQVPLEAGQKAGQKSSVLIRRDKKAAKKNKISLKRTQQPGLPVEIKDKEHKMVGGQRFSDGLYGDADKKIRRNALQIKKAVEDEEKELLEKEKAWETPAIFRRKDNR